MTGEIGHITWDIQLEHDSIEQPTDSNAAHTLVLVPLFRDFAQVLDELVLVPVVVEEVVPVPVRVIYVGRTLLVTGLQQTPGYGSRILDDPDALPSASQTQGS